VGGGYADVAKNGTGGFCVAHGLSVSKLRRFHILKR
jgi:hypothetical protein